MVILDYKKSEHKEIIHACAEALKEGKIIAYPTDTCYGLGVDATNFEAVKKLYTLKGRDFNKPIHIIPPTEAYAKKIVEWSRAVKTLARTFLPGPLTIISRIKNQEFINEAMKRLSGGTGFLGIRFPNNEIALDLAKYLKLPITTTSANVSGRPEIYSASELERDFGDRKYKPDIIINVGTLKKKKPSTLVKIENNQIQILREGPISEKQIKKAVKVKK